MTTRKDFKQLVRARAAQTGESYTTARVHLLGGQKDEAPDGESAEIGEPIEAVVLKINERSARLRVVGEPEQVTLRSSDIHRVLPGQIATVRFGRRWAYRGDAYASGAIDGARTDIAALRLEALPLEELRPDDPAEWSEPYDDDSDPYTALWRRNTGRPRPSFEMHPIAWEGIEAFRSGDPDDAPISEAAEIHASGAHPEARAMVMDVLCADLRCIDGHAHLGNWAFRRDPRRAQQHYEIGIGIGELSLEGRPPDLLLTWGHLYNRPFLRCLHGLARCRWRLGDFPDAQRILERLLSLNPTDNQGARFDWHDVMHARRWEQAIADDS